MKLARPELSTELSNKLTEEEIEAFNLWLGSQYRVAALREELAALSLTENMALAKKWLEREGDTVAARTVATDITFHWQDLRRLLVKNGLLD